MKIQIFIIILLTSILLLGCTTKTEDRIEPSTSNTQNTQATQVQPKMHLSSPDWMDTRWQIYNNFTCFGQDISPSFTVINLPSNTKSLAIMMYDGSAPSGMFVHWMVYDLPVSKTSFSQNESLVKTVKNDFGVYNYRGPCPQDTKVHNYKLEIFALDVASLGNINDKASFISGIQKHIIDSGMISSYYSRD